MVVKHFGTVKVCQLVLFAHSNSTFGQVPHIPMEIKHTKTARIGYFLGFFIHMGLPTAFTLLFPLPLNERLQHNFSYEESERF